MKKKFIFLRTIVLISCILLNGGAVGCVMFTGDKAETPIQLQKIVQGGKLSSTLLEILQITNIKHDGTLASIVEATQKDWLRKAGTERWEMDNAREELKPALEPLFKKLGIIDEVAPTAKQYTYGLILGATITSMRERFAYALDLWKKGVVFTHLVFLVGERPLDPVKESEAILYDAQNVYLPFRPDWKNQNVQPKTETDAAKLLFDQANLPKEFKDSVKVTFIDTPMQKLPDGTFRRPNTGDTVNLFKPMLEKTPGTILAISNQPYVGYQDAVTRTLLAGYSVETVGAKAKGSLHIGVTLDNLARWIYQEHHYQQSLAKK